MNDTLYQERNTTFAAERMLKDTALLYFADALNRERFETCAELLAAARQFGAQPAETERVIADYLRWGTVFAGDAARRPNRGRVRF